MLRKNRAKIFCKISRNPARPAHKKLRAVGQHALRILYNLAESLPSQHCIQIRKSKRPASESRKFCAQLARKYCKVSEQFRRAARTKSCVNSASVVSQTSELRCSSFNIRCAFLCKITRESSVEITQILRKNLAKNCKTSRNPARPAHKKLRALVDRELCIPHNVAEN